LAVKQAAVDASQAALDQATLDLGYTVIKAPFAGRVSRELVDAGNLVGASEMTLLTTLVVDDPIYAYFNVSERDLLTILQEQGGRPSNEEEREKAPVLLQFADGTMYDIVGEVDFFDTRVDPTTGTLQIRAVFDNPPPGRLFPGLFCRIRAPQIPRPAVLVPERALMRDIEGSYVLIVDDTNTVRRRNVQRGRLLDDNRREIIQVQSPDGEPIADTGLDGSARVIVEGLQRARVGVVVNPVERQAMAESGAPSAG
jgi:RND family efflux transporter MFP subunit